MLKAYEIEPEQKQTAESATTLWVMRQELKQRIIFFLLKHLTTF